MGKASRDKGLRRERALVEIHKQSGIPAERVPLSGATRYRGNGADIDIYVRGAAEPPLVAEVKARGDGEGFHRPSGANRRNALRKGESTRLHRIPLVSGVIAPDAY